MGLLDHVKIENLDEDQRKMVELVGLDGFKSLVGLLAALQSIFRRQRAWNGRRGIRRFGKEFDGGNYRACREIWTYRALGEIHPVRKTG